MISLILLTYGQIGDEPADMADLLEIPTPLRAGVGGMWSGEPFVVEGRLQMDRAGAPGAPWQEILISFPNQGNHLWIAYAQGRWYGTSEQPMPPTGVPPMPPTGMPPMPPLPGSQTPFTHVPMEQGSPFILGGSLHMPVARAHTPAS